MKQIWNSQNFRIPVAAERDSTVVVSISTKFQGNIVQRNVFLFGNKRNVE
jgi:hypothetical protein